MGMDPRPEERTIALPSAPAMLPTASASQAPVTSGPLLSCIRRSTAPASPAFVEAMSAERRPAFATLGRPPALRIVEPSAVVRDGLAPGANRGPLDPDLSFGEASASDGPDV